jgi:hypothetical protein
MPDLRRNWEITSLVTRQFLPWLLQLTKKIADRNPDTTFGGLDRTQYAVIWAYPL